MKTVKIYKANKNGYWFSLAVGILLFSLSLLLFFNAQKHVVSLLSGFLSLVFIYASSKVIIKGKQIALDNEGITLSHLNESKILWVDIKRINVHNFKGIDSLIIEVHDFHKYPSHHKLPKDFLNRIGAKETDIVLGFGGFESQKSEIISATKEMFSKKIN